METWPGKLSCFAWILWKIRCSGNRGAGKAAYALSNSRDLRCRVILEQIKDYNQFPEDQGLASLGLAMVMKETTGMLQDDVRLVAARGKLLKDAIIKCYDSSFGPIPVQNIVKGGTV